MTCVGCTRQVYVPVERTVRDTLRTVMSRIDSITVRDSVVTSIKGDTVRIESWKWRIRDRVRTDTLLRTRTDTVTVVAASPAGKGTAKREPGIWEIVGEAVHILKWVTRILFCGIMLKIFLGWWKQR